MNNLNILLTLTSLNVVLVSIERFSFTARVLLPGEFLRLHELVQITSLILFTVLIPIFLLRFVTYNFETIKYQKGFLLFLIFIIGIYFYSTGNGFHEVSSFAFNQFCGTASFYTGICQSLFINDYYTGNIMYFFGAALTVIPLLLFEKMRSSKEFSRNQLLILIANSAVFAFTIFYYAGFDRVIVGLIYSLIMSAITLSLFLTIKPDFRRYPIITYNTIAYLLGTTAALLIRFH